jgi:ABC-2 type transport system ATP-binding protein
MRPAGATNRYGSGISELHESEAEDNVTADPSLRAQRPPGPGDPAVPVIATTALTKRYPGPVTALDQLTVAVGPGITGLVGSNGAGKSTLIKVLLGLLTPTSGTASVLGTDCVAGGYQIRMLTGYMPEHDCLPPDVTATEFVAHLGRMSGLPATAAKERAADSLRHVGLYEERYRQIGTYSTGMKKRVKLAQALVGDPRLLLLDEPTNGLDPAGRSAMLDLIRRIGDDFGISILVASHLLGEIEQICDQLVAIDGGRLLRADTISSFTTSREVLLVEVEEGSQQLAAELGRRGLEPVPYQKALLVQLAGEDTYDTVRDAIADLGLPLNRMEQRRHRLEELFQPDAAPAFETTGAGDVR